MTNQTLVEKIISHRIGREVSAGDVVNSPLDLMWGCSMTVYWAFKQLERAGFLEGDYDPQIQKNIEKLGVVFDHFILPTPEKLMPIFDYLRQKSEQYGFEIFEPEHNGGIQHRLFEMMGMIMPGDIAIGADSHSTTAGALGAMSTGVGSTDLAVGILTGNLPLKVPDSIQVNLEGEFVEGVNTKDLILYMAGLFGESGANYQVLEFAGPGVAEIPMHHRFIPSNMSVELGAKTGLFPVDQTTLNYLEETHRQFPDRSRFTQDLSPLESDEGANYTFRINIDLGELQPMVALPYSPSNVIGIHQLEYALENWGTMPDLIKQRLENIPHTWPIKVNGVYWGGCTNGRSQDLEEHHATLEGFNSGIDVVINPASEHDLEILKQAGIWQKYIESGARTEGVKCGLCFGASSQWSDEGLYIHVTNRNFLGRTAKGVKVLLTSSDTAKETAIVGSLATQVPRPTDRQLHIRMIADVVRAKKIRSSLRDTLYNRPIEPYQHSPEGVELKVWRFGDDINTDQMMNAAACKLEDPAEYMKFLLLDAGNEAFNTFYKTNSYNLSADVVVGGHNFGCGSSRENAAEGIKLSETQGIVAGSFARIFWRNAINLGVPLYEIGDAVTDIDEGDRIILDPDNMAVYNTTKGNRYQAKPLPELSKKILDDGGVMLHIKKTKENVRTRI